MELKVVSLDRVYGPLSLEKLVQLAAQGRLSPHDQVRAAGTSTWHSVTDVPAVAASMPQPSMAQMAAEGGTDVDLTILRDGRPLDAPITVTRGKIKQRNVFAEMIPGDGPVFQDQIGEECHRDPAHKKGLSLRGKEARGTKKFKGQRGHGGIE